MELKEFEKVAKHLKQKQVITGALNAISQVLVNKGICTKDEIQEQFLNWMIEQGYAKTPKEKKGKLKVRKGKTEVVENGKVIGQQG